METAVSDARSRSLRDARVGALLPARLRRSGRVRVLDATAFLVPGRGQVETYLAALEEAADEFAAWDGRVVVVDPDGQPTHRLAIVDRYGQFYSVTDADDVSDLPDAAALAEWFRFLATACPECGVIDDPRQRDWVP